jgi:hypothetical protein
MSTCIFNGTTLTFLLNGMIITILINNMSGNEQMTTVNDTLAKFAFDQCKGMMMDMVVDVPSEGFAMLADDDMFVERAYDLLIHNMGEGLHNCTLENEHLLRELFTPVKADIRAMFLAYRSSVSSKMETVL